MGKRLLRVALLALLVSGSVVSWSYWQDPLFWRRWWVIVTHLSPDHMDFRPTAAIGGGTVQELPSAPPDRLAIAPAALRDAERYAARFDSYALIVVHRGVVQTEWYAPGWDRNRLTQSQSMMKTLAALSAVPKAFAELIDRGVRVGAFRPVHPFAAYVTMIAPIIFFLASTPIRRELEEKHLLEAALPPSAFIAHVQATLRQLLTETSPQTPQASKMERQS